MDINDLIVQWNHANCTIMDVRRITLGAGESIRSYCVPSSLFLMSIRGNAAVHLAGEVHRVQRFTVLHAGKGAVLDIVAGSEGLDYYSVYYKANLNSPLPSELSAQRAQSFDIPYSITPDNPVALHQIMSEMIKEWKWQPLARLRVRTLLYQFVHELLRQMSVHGIRSAKRDLAAQVADIIHEHYASNITLESLSESLNYSVPHLSSYFKIRTGLSPIDYLIKVRIDKAAALLLETDATLKEIAIGVGYQDPSYMGRLFKKHKGVSPIGYREANADKKKLADSPVITMRSSIVPPESFIYTDLIDNGYHNQWDGEGDLYMFKQSKPMLASALLLSLILILSACGANSTTEKGASQSNHNDASAASDHPKTKIVKTVNGDVEIPLHPKRIVAGEYLGSLIALGITPIGTSDHHIKNPYFQEYLKEVANIGDGNGNVEQILSLDPDLIILDDMYPELNEQMKKIAPTVVIPYASLKTVHEEVTYFGELLGQEDKAKAWLEDYDSRIASAKASVLKVIPADSTFSVIEIAGDKSLMAVGTDYGKGGQPIYNGFGFKPPAEIAAEMAEPGWASFSAEVLSKYAGDYIILTSDSQKLDDIKADPIWGLLPAVKNDHVFLWTSDRSGYWDPIAILSQTEQLAAWLTSL
ncbi:AraC family transcriptional regulator [Paenibacillus sp. NPDC058071]|uniref:AraC family transcriptional regulator n=1 Tax=Paenibacillus sp. NPDC058071 TaxID=3346326 RepID=UPI0036DCE4F5